MQVTCSYLELARQIDQVKAVRAVAAVHGANAIATVISASGLCALGVISQNIPLVIYLANLAG